MSKVVLSDALKLKLKDTRPKQMTIKNPVKCIDKFIRLGHDFEVSTTSRSYRITNKTQNLIYLAGGKNYSMKEFHLQRELKSVIRGQIKKNNLKVPVFTEKDILYKLYSDNVLNLEEGVVLDNVVEYDINKAYYQCAYNLGYLDEDMYLKCLEMDKEKRLRFLGSIATQKVKYSYVGGVLNIDSFKEVKDEDLRGVWFHICKVVDDCLLDFANVLGDNFLMYYVDGIYLKDFKGRGKVLKMISEKWGFSFSDTPVTAIEKVQYLSSLNNKEVAYSSIMITKLSNGVLKPKPFYLSNRINNNISEGLYRDALKNMFVYD